ncbi:ABC transporter ATP-binding protein [Streptomyces sp. AC536]|uniref:ATP-binding cassette domain-containing protein n=1 Tax=Streptomyces buecherae TaxID=2763006 RepID=UPI00164E20ED|nr:ABC transporter ATP-binding protein [Streptomyces buecherae]MBC3986659.1 ABC transporter ATP-binding protein [Streptomyces buecherae]QNJ43007.1 ABC transporter ATP-binding protein [Streptomyces buecherae]
MTSEYAGDPGAAIVARGLGKRYRQTWALREVTLRLPAGRICAVIGPNGSGKSTLLAMAAGLLAPTTGSLSLFGEARSTSATRRRVAYVAQDKPLFPRLTVAETLRFGRELNPGWDQAVAERVLRDVDIPTGARISTLSGGQRTCVALALALGKRADLLLLDEPMADQDPLRRSRMMGALMAEAAEHGTTVVIATHVLAELDGVSDHLWLFGAGRLRLAGDTEAIQSAHALVTGARRDGERAGDRASNPGLPPELAAHAVVEARATGRQLTVLVRPGGTELEGEWITREPSVEEILLGYLRNPTAPPLLLDGGPTDAPEVAA